MTSSLDIIRGRQVVQTLTNQSGGAVIAGDVVIVSAANDESFTTTTSAAYNSTRVGVAQESIAAAATGRILLEGYAPLVNVSASATRGHYLLTHTVAKQATSQAGYAAGAFGQILKAGTTPSAMIFPVAQVGSAGVTRSGSTTDGHLAVWNGSNADSIKDGGAIGAVGDMTWAAVQASQLVNEIKGWPPVVQPDSDLVTLNLWWDDVATPTTKATAVDVAGEAGITETFELALKCVGDGAGDGLQQTWTYADEPRLKSGRVMSALLAIWSVGGISITAKLVNSDASETAASAVTAAAWTIVEIPNHTLAGTTVSLQVTAGAAGTFYVVPLGANIGARGFALRPRGLRRVNVGTASVLSGVDPGGADFTDLDLTTQTSPLAVMVEIQCLYSNSAAVNIDVFARRNGSTETSYPAAVLRNQVASIYMSGIKLVDCDDNQIIEWKTNAAAGNAESLFLSINGWWEWE